MNALIALILIGTLGFLFGRFLFLKPRPGSSLQRIIVSGVEFLLLGALLGPYGAGILGPKELQSLEPFLLLALTWVGLLVGLQLRGSHLIRFPASYFRLAFTQSLAALGLGFAALAGILALWNPFGPSLSPPFRGALFLAAIASLSSPTEAALHSRRARTGHAAGLLRFVPAVDPLVALAATAFLFSFWHVAEGGVPGNLAPAAWILISIAGGALLGVLFLLLLRTATGQDEIVVVVLGMAVFSGGLAAVFRLSPLVVGLVEGILLANLVPREGLVQLFLRLERPLYVALLVLAGAVWRFEEPWGYALTLVFLAVRVASKYAGTRLGVKVAALPFPLPGGWWLGLLPQGAMAMAIGVSYVLVYRDPLSHAAFSAVVVSTMLLTLFSGRMVEKALG